MSQQFKDYYIVQNIFIFQTVLSDMNLGILKVLQIG